MSICTGCGVFSPLALINDYSGRTAKCEICGQKLNKTKVKP
jgi:rRNA maturation endonuclease Nob1